VTAAHQWRGVIEEYRDRLPVTEATPVVTLREGGTPLVLGGSVIVSLGTRDQKSVVAFDAATGKELWAAKYAWGSSYSSPIAATLHGRECVLAYQGGMSDPPTGGLLVIDAKTGAVLSATPHRAKMFASASISAPVVAGSRVFVAEAYTEGGMCVDIASNFLQGLEHEYDPRTWIARYPSRKPSLRSKQIHRDVAYELQTVTLVTLLVYFQRASLSGDEDTLIRRCKVEKLTTYLAIVSRASSCR